MKFLIAFALAIACAAADVSHLNSANAAAVIVKSTFDSSPEGPYQWAVETSNGIYSEASGVFENVNSDNPSLKITGRSRYTSPEGTPIEISYTADENGYHATGDSIPVGPEIPDYIRRSIQYIEDHPAAPQNVAAAVLG